MNLRGLRATALRAAPLLLALAIGCSLPGSAKPTPSRPNLAGELTSLRGAPAGTRAEVAAISLVDASVAAATTTSDARYELRVPAGPYLLVARSTDRATGRTVTTTSATVEAKDQPRTVSFPPLVTSPFGLPALPSRAATVTGVTGIAPIAISGPAGLGLGTNAAGAITTGLLDPCRARGGRLVDLDPAVREAIEREQRLSDEGRTDTRFHVDPLAPDTTIEGSVTVGPDGTPLVDLVIRDAAGRELRHIVLRGDAADGNDIGRFLRGLGPGLAAELCPKPQPTPPPAVGTAPPGPPPPAGHYRLAVRVDGGSSVEYHFGAGKFYCGDTGKSGHPLTCDLDVPAGAEVDMQRTLSLTNDEESRWRLASWGGPQAPCPAAGVDTEPRGGHCRFVMDRARAVNVTFERRAALRVTHQLIDEIPLGFTWRLSASAQKGLGNPLAFTSAGQNCSLPARPVPGSGPAGDYKVANPCDNYAMYDAGSTVTIVVESGSADVRILKSWGGPCTGQGATCTFTLVGDQTVTGNFSQR